MSTQSQKQPPRDPPASAIAAADDHIRKLGDEIARLNAQQSRELHDYLDAVHGIHV